MDRPFASCADILIVVFGVWLVGCVPAESVRQEPGEGYEPYPVTIVTQDAELRHVVVEQLVGDTLIVEMGGSTMSLALSSIETVRVVVGNQAVIRAAIGMVTGAIAGRSVAIILSMGIGADPAKPESGMLYGAVLGLGLGAVVGGMIEDERIYVLSDKLPGWRRQMMLQMLAEMQR